MKNAYVIDNEKYLLGRDKNGQIHYISEIHQRYVAWCDDLNTVQFADDTWAEGEILLLIGPEGDFSTEEINTCRSLGYKEVKLGSRRLRTETAALFGCFTVALRNA